MVNANATSLARETRQMLDGRDIRGLAAVTIGAGGGLILAQRLTDRIMSMLNLSVEPASAMEFGASIAIKVGLALVAGFAAMQVSGLALIGLAFAALGSLASAGVDLMVGLLTLGRNGSSANQRRTDAGSNQESAGDSSHGSPSASSSASSAKAAINGM